MSSACHIYADDGIVPRKPVDANGAGVKPPTEPVVSKKTRGGRRSSFTKLMAHGSLKSTYVA